MSELFPRTSSLRHGYDRAQVEEFFSRARQAYERAAGPDAELSPLVRRSFSITNSTTLRVDYSATTNRMLRVAVNGFFESIGVVTGVMKELDVDVYQGEVEGGLEGVQGLEGVNG